MDINLDDYNLPIIWDMFKALYIRVSNPDMLYAGIFQMVVYTYYQKFSLELHRKF